MDSQIHLENAFQNPRTHQMTTGRPTIYTEELATTICRRIAEGESLRSICADEAMPSASTICRWLLEPDKKTFWEQYAHARNVQAELMFDELLEIADNGSNDFMTIKKRAIEYNIEDREVTNRSPGPIRTV